MPSVIANSKLFSYYSSLTLFDFLSFEAIGSFQVLQSCRSGKTNLYHLQQLNNLDPAENTTNEKSTIQQRADIKENLFIKAKKNSIISSPFQQKQPADKESSSLEKQNSARLKGTSSVHFI